MLPFPSTRSFLVDLHAVCCCTGYLKQLVEERKELADSLELDRTDLETQLADVKRRLSNVCAIVTGIAKMTS